MEAAKLDVLSIIDVFPVSGEAIGHPGVVSNRSGTHPNAVSFRIWSQATATPRPLGDDLPPWFNNHEIYHAPSPKFDQLREPICKHNGILPDDTITLSTGLYGYRRVNDGFIEAQPSGIEGIYEEDSTMYFEYESGILRFPGARGPAASHPQLLPSPKQQQTRR